MYLNNPLSKITINHPSFYLFFILLILTSGTAIADWYSVEGHYDRTTSGTTTIYDTGLNVTLDTTEYDAGIPVGDHSDNITDVNIHLNISDVGSNITYSNVTHTGVTGDTSFNLTNSSYSYDRPSNPTTVACQIDSNPYSFSNISIYSQSQWENYTHEIYNCTITDGMLQLNATSADGYYVSTWFNITSRGRNIYRTIDSYDLGNCSLYIRENYTDGWTALSVDDTYQNYQLNITLGSGGYHADVAEMSDNPAYFGLSGNISQMNTDLSGLNWWFEDGKIINDIEVDDTYVYTAHNTYDMVQKLWKSNGTLVWENDDMTDDAEEIAVAPDGHVHCYDKDFKHYKINPDGTTEFTNSTERHQHAVAVDSDNSYYLAWMPDDLSSRYISKFDADDNWLYNIDISNSAETLAVDDNYLYAQEFETMYKYYKSNGTEVASDNSWGDFNDFELDGSGYIVAPDGDADKIITAWASNLTVIDKHSVTNPYDIIASEVGYYYYANWDDKIFKCWISNHTVKSSFDAGSRAYSICSDIPLYSRGGGGGSAGVNCSHVNISFYSSTDLLLNGSYNGSNVYDNHIHILSSDVNSTTVNSNLTYMYVDALIGNPDMNYWVNRTYGAYSLGSTFTYLSINKTGSAFIYFNQTLSSGHSHFNYSGYNFTNLSHVFIRPSGHTSLTCSYNVTFTYIVYEYHTVNYMFDIMTDVAFWALIVLTLVSMIFAIMTKSIFAPMLVFVIGLFMLAIAGILGVVGGILIPTVCAFVFGGYYLLTIKGDRR